MKGHVLGDVEGMWSWRLIHGVQLFRPLLQRRKDDFVALLNAFPTPHFRDSTPGAGEKNCCLEDFAGKTCRLPATCFSRYEQDIWEDMGIRIYIYT